MLETRFTVGETVWIEPGSPGPRDGEARITEDCDLGYFVEQDGQEWYVTDSEATPL